MGLGGAGKDGVTLSQRIPLALAPIEHRRPTASGEPIHDRRSSQLHWSRGGLDDSEQVDPDEGEPDADEEHWQQPVHIGQPPAGAAQEGSRHVIDKLT